ncbi:MAG TPA: GNAT family N-acetyltransferase, partial [Erythrobacter sp.]|nr:GNAT family N-acetyltransferase [Erythrobacter sp.]
MFHVTERLLLRPAWPEDAEALLGGIADEAIVRNLASAPWPYLPKHAREFVMRQHDPRYPVFLVTLPTGSGSEVIGCIGIDPCDSADAEIGYWIARPHWGQG